MKATLMNSKQSAALFAKLLQETASVRESSYNTSAAEAEQRDKGVISFATHYGKTMHEAAVEVCGEEHSLWVEMVHSCLCSSWNESLAWATTILNAPKEA